MRTTSFTIAIFLLFTSIIAFTTCESGPAYPQGKNLYAFHCQNCHMEDGSGLGANIPPLAKADYLQTNKDQLACIIRYGLADTIVVNGATYAEPMEGISVKVLNDIQVANLINYIHHAWGNDLGFITVEDVREQLKNCK